MSDPEDVGVTRKAVRFFGRQAAYTLGWEHIKQGRQAVSLQWSRASKRICPLCEEGRLFGFASLIDGKKVKFMGCSRCEYHHRAAPSVAALLLSRLRGKKIKTGPENAELVVLRAKAQEKMAAMTADEIAEVVRKHRVGSRILFLASLGMLLFGFGMLIDGALGGDFGSDAALSFLGVLTVSVLLFAKGLVASYRSWQLRERVFFVPGSFQEWLKAGKWLV